jgi:hypothetical protein
MPLAPKWGVKKNSEGKNFYWYGYKGHLAVGTQSQNILRGLLSSRNLNEGKAAISLLKGLKILYPTYAHDHCQKVYKIKITTDLRKYCSAPARGSKAWKEIAKRRSAAERVNAYLKEFFSA